MRPAGWPRAVTADEKLAVVDVHNCAIAHRRVGALPSLLAPGDLLVVNDAATLPASLRGRIGDVPVEVRLVGARDDGRWDAVLFGAGDWRTRTELRPPPPTVKVSDTIALGEVRASVERVSDLSPRLVRLRFSVAGDALWAALYRHGRPVQYAHLDGELPLWHAQTPYASRPWAVEMPSAGRPLAWDLLLALPARGVGLARVTHAAGLSSTGDAALDAALPLPERSFVPAATIDAIARARRVIAVGTTVVRALEGNAAAHDGALVAGETTTDLRLGPSSPLRIAGGIFTGMHEPGTSHFALLEAFAPRALLARALDEAEARGALAHEFGDSMLILSDVRT